jgi:hypothetical protein
MGDAEKNQYPSEWMLGKIMGSFYDKNNSIKAVISIPENKKEKIKFFSYSNAEEKEEAIKLAKVWLLQTSNDNELTRNQIRFLDADTIEIKLTNNLFLKNKDEKKEYTFTTDSKFLNLVQKYKLFWSGHVMCQYKKKKFPFLKLICNFELSRYIDKNPLNCKINNILNLGNKEQKEKCEYLRMIESNKEICCNKQNLFFSLFNKNKINELPKGKWILGKISGYIEKTKDGYIAKVKNEDGNKNKYFTSINNAQIYQICASFHLGMTKNLIRILNDNIIEVKLTNGKIMITDLVFLPIIQQHVIYEKSGGHNRCILNIDGKEINFNDYISGIIGSIHLNGNKYDNRYINLSDSKILTYKNTDINESNDKNGNSGYRCRFKLLGTEFSKFFLNDKYPNAKVSAIDYKSKICSMTFENFDVKMFQEEKQDIISKLKEYHTKYLDELQENYTFLKKNENNFENKFNISKEQSNDMYKYMKTIIKHKIEITEEKIKYFDYFEKKKQYKNPKNLISKIIQNMKYDPLIKYKDEETSDEYPDSECINNENINTINNNESNDEDEDEDEDENEENNNVENIMIKSNKVIFTGSNDDMVMHYYDLLNTEIPEKTTTVIKNENRIQYYYKEFCGLVVNKKGKVISEEEIYKDAHSKLDVKCKYKHEFSISYNNLKANKWCPLCSALKMESFAKEIIEEIFDEIFVKMRPKWLEGLELDIYNEKLKIAFEYNGIQHYEYVPYFHRQESKFIKQQENDKKKIKLCKENNIKLIIIPYDKVTEINLKEYIINELKNNDINININKENKDKQIKKIIKAKSENIKKKSNSDSNTDTESTSESDTEQKECENSKIIKQIIQEKGGKIINGTYVTKNSLFTIECKNKHQWTTKATNIIYQKNWCFECSKEKARTKDKDRAETLKDWFKTDAGKENKQKSLAKRSETMQKEKEELRKKVEEAGEKVCTGKCGGDPKPLCNFGKKADSKDGYQSWCKTCINEYKKEKKAKK